MLEFQIWEIFMNKAPCDISEDVTRAEMFTKSILEGAECLITSVDNGNISSIKSSIKSMSKARNFGKHKCLFYNHESGKEEAVAQEDLINIKAFVNNSDKNGRYINTKWIHSNGDLVPMVCFVQRPVCTQNEKTIKSSEFNGMLQTFLRVHGSGDFRDGYHIRVEDQLWNWGNEQSFILAGKETPVRDKMNSKFYSNYQNVTQDHMFFVAFCALRRVVGLLRQLPPNRRTTTWNNIYVLEGGEKVWERTLSLVTPYAISHLKLGMKAWVHRKQKGTVLLVNDGTYDVRRDTAKTLRAIEDGKDIKKVITVPAEDVEAVKVSEAKEFDKSSMVELFLQCRSLITHLNLNYTDIGVHGARALQVLLAGVNIDLSTEALDAKKNLDALAQERVKAFYKKYSTLKAPAMSIFLKPQPLLTTLNLRACGLGLNGIDALAKGLFTNQTVTSLDLGANNLSDDGVRKLSAVLANQPSMKHLDLRGNAITGVGALALAKNIAQFQIGIVKGM